MANRPKGFGMTAELSRKVKATFVPNLDQTVRHWMEAVLGEPIADADPQVPMGSDGMHAALKDGTVLCKLVNKIKPGSVKNINTGKTATDQKENIESFLSACDTLGVPKDGLFQTEDLLNNKNMSKVLATISLVGTRAPKVGYNGPTIGDNEVGAVLENVKKTF